MPIKLQINVGKILKEHIYEGAKGKYLNLVLWETPDDKYSNDYRVVQDLSKEARDAGEKGPIVGNGKNFGDSARKKPAAKPERRQETREDTAEDDIPF